MRCATTSKHLRDRKSTRLNSSHLVISYAVFCLKKSRVGRAALHVLQLRADSSDLAGDSGQCGGSDGALVLDSGCGRSSASAVFFFCCVKPTAFFLFLPIRSLMPA